EVDLAATWRTEVPAAAGGAEVQVRAENARAAIERPRRVLDVHVIDPVRERAQERHRVDELPEQMTGIEIEAKLGPVVERHEGCLRRVEIKGDLRWVDLQREPDAAFLEDIEDRVPALGEEFEAVGDPGVGDRRE